MWLASCGKGENLGEMGTYKDDKRVTVTVRSRSRRV